MGVVGWEMQNPIKFKNLCIFVFFVFIVLHPGPARLGRPGPGVPGPAGPGESGTHKNCQFPTGMGVVGWEMLKPT